MQLLDADLSPSLSILDRGLTLGDGFFSTMHVCQGRVRLLSYHLARIQYSLERLGFLPVAREDLQSAMQAKAADLVDGVLKIIITRGQGGRGYSPAGCVSPTVIFSVHPYPAHYHQWQQQGIELGLLSHRIGSSPLLAGLKTLGRLEQVLLKAELESTGLAEGVVCDEQGNMVEAVTANLFWRRGCQVFTPSLSRAGVAGVMRAWCLERLQHWQQPVADVVATPVCLAGADEIWLTNALMGVVPVRCFAAQQLVTPGAICRRLQQSYRDEVEN